MIKVKPSELRDLLKYGKVHFEYEKQDGSLRQANGTLDENLIPENLKPKDSSTFKSKNLRYFDIEKNDWRSISGSVTEVTVL